MKNTGNYNTGNYNTGNYNTGHCNSGDRNTGDRNSGERNTGNYNTGHCNSGDHNTGNHNTGHYNTGDRNTGHYNSGDHNTGNHNTGAFNTQDGPIYLFNKYTDKITRKELETILSSLKVIPVLQWISESSMTSEEKQNNPSYKTTGGYLKNTGRNDYSKLTEKNKKDIMSLPNFDNEIFKQITGVSLLEEMIEVTHNGKTLKLNLSKAKELGLIEE